MRNAAQARKEVGGSTVFNALGPLLNPVSARRRQLIGVYDSRLLCVVAEALEHVGIERGIVVYGHPGMDEVSLLGRTEAVIAEGGRLERTEIDPARLGMRISTAYELRDRPPSESAGLALSILSGEERGAPRDAVVLNAACCLDAFGRCSGIERGITLAETAIDSGSAMGTLDRFKAANAIAARSRGST